jgi:RHS repeat-associated protein
VNPTPNVAFSYDAYFPRLASMSDGAGATQYGYVGGFSFGALQLQQECFVPTGASACASQIDYAYDGLGRRSARTVSGAGSETFQYDALGRLTGHASDLGAFALSYLGQTGQIAQRRLLPFGSSLSTSWSYLPNSGDRRLAGISNVGLSASQFSNFQFTTTPENLITSITQTSDVTAAAPSAISQTASYNALNQLTTLSGQALSYDSNGNLLSDGQRAYSWDAENRLVGIVYPGQPGKATAFAYDGLGRRTRITNTPAGGGSPVATSYVWCGSKLCQARDAGGALTREYLDEGEFAPGSPALTAFYGVDQIGSVRRVFASTTNAPAYDYDPYGNPLQATPPVTDFTYAGLLNHPASGLSLATHRAYDPVVGRWISRDPIGEGTDAAANLYAYVGGQPTRLTDPSGKNPAIAVVACLEIPVCAATVAGAAAWAITHVAALKPLDRGGEEWGRRKGCGPDAGRRAPHATKNSDPMAGPQDDYQIDPDTGDVFDPNGDYVGNAGDNLGSRK